MTVLVSPDSPAEASHATNRASGTCECTVAAKHLRPDTTTRHIGAHDSFVTNCRVALSTRASRDVSIVLANRRSPERVRVAQLYDRLPSRRVNRPSRSLRAKSISSQSPARRGNSLVGKQEPAFTSRMERTAHHAERCWLRWRHVSHDNYDLRNRLRSVSRSRIFRSRMTLGVTSTYSSSSMYSSAASK